MKAPQGVVTVMNDCVARIATSYHGVVTFQPASRYWPLQWYELCVFLAAALLLAGACAWRIRRVR
jgi:CHASE2 domain-containing sensor protein